MGIGYNLFNGYIWGTGSNYPITSGWAINSSYTDYGENGELCVSQGQNGLYICTREIKGQGPWQEFNLAGNLLKHPVIVIAGASNDIFHLLYLESDPDFIPTEPQPVRGEIWYSSSQDNGQTWNSIPMPGLGPDFYLGFTMGAYCWAEPRGNVLAMVAGDFLTDLILMKSNDGGLNWEKTIVWEHPYPFFVFFAMNTDTFYCNNGGISVALDNDNNAHITFGISKVISHDEPSPVWYFPEVGGLAYWHEGMQPFSNNVNALNPYNHPESELIQDYNLIAWMLDINGNGQIDTLGNFSSYPTPGLIIMPQIVISDQNEIYVIFNTVTEDFVTQDYRHLWARASPDGGNHWGDFYYLNADLIHSFDECIYPSASASIIGDKLSYLYSYDYTPGIVGYGQANYTDNSIVFSELTASPLLQYLSVDFTASDTVINEGNSITFQNLSNGIPEPVSFSWTFEGGTPSFSNLENPTIVYNEPGIFDVTLNISNGVMNKTLTRENYIMVLEGLVINQLQDDKQWIISPNPTNGKFTIYRNSEEVFSIRIFNLLGQEIINKAFSHGQLHMNLDISHHPEGIYFISGKFGETKRVKRIIFRKE